MGENQMKEHGQVATSRCTQRCFSRILTITQQSLFGLEAPAISILSIFFSSLLL